MWAGHELSVSQSPLMPRHTAKPAPHTSSTATITTTCGGSMRFSAADSACDMPVRGPALRTGTSHALWPQPRGPSRHAGATRQTVSATHTTSCIQLEYVASLTGSETSRMLARCTGYRSGTQSSRLADREKKYGDQGHLPRQRSHCHPFRPRTARRPRVRASSPPYLDRDDDRDIRRTKPSCWRSEATGDLLVANIGGLPSALRDRRPGGRLPRDREAS